MLHLFCGKIASGKSTLAARIAQSPQTVLIAEDHWLATLFGDQMSTGADYLHYAGKLRTLLKDHVAAVLQAGTSVVLDFPANTPDQRRWMRALIAASGAAHQMHVFDTTDALCLARLRNRNAAGNHAFAVTEDQFHRFARHFSLPTASEGFTLIRH